MDTDLKKVESIRKGICPIDDEDLMKKTRRTKLIATTDFHKIKESDIVIVCVPTPVDDESNPDLGPLTSACREIGKNLRKNHLIIIESTINPGICEEIVLPILEESGLKAGSDFDLAHCPERIDPGNKKWRLQNIARVVGATTESGLHKAVSFYRSIIDAQIKPMSTIKGAEATKIIENTFRDINIAFVNELAMSFDKIGIDLKEVIEGAATKPFAFLAHYPGCGVGGHCIPVDPYYLIEHARKNGFNHKFLKLAREINNSMPAYTVDLLSGMLDRIKKPLKGTTVGVMGISYKKNIDDDRESPAYEIIRHLKKREATVVVFDPYFPDKSDATSTSEFLDLCDAVILTCNHDEFMRLSARDFEKHNIRVLIDGRNAYDKADFRDSAVSYKGIGV